MSTSGQHDTFRRVVTSAAILGAAVVLFDGGRGLTGRAGGGAVGCGGYEETAGDAQGVSGAGSFQPSAAAAAVTALTPVLDPGRPWVSFRPAPNPRLPAPVAPAAPAPAAPVPTKPGIGLPGPRPGPDLFSAMEDVGAGRFAVDFRASGLAAVLSSSSRRFTVFAPTDLAWERFRQERPELFDAKNAVLLEEVMGQHVIAEEMVAQTWKPGIYPSIMPGVRVRFDGDQRTANVGSDIGAEAEVQVDSEILARNGATYAVDDVVVPPFTPWAQVRNLGFDLFVTVVEAAGQVGRFAQIQDPMTVLAPSDDALLAAGWDAHSIAHADARASLEAIVDAHVIESSMSIEKLATQPRATADGELVKATTAPGGQPSVLTRIDNGVQGTVELPDYSHDYGYVHAVDAVFVVE